MAESDIVTPCKPSQTVSFKCTCRHCEMVSTCGNLYMNLYFRFSFDLM